MSADALATELAALETRLLELISCLECDPLPSRRVLDSSWGEVHRAFENVRTLLVGAPEPMAAHADPLERCQRLHVLATGLLTRRRDELAAERQAFRLLRTRLESTRREHSHGDSCDVSA